MKLAYGKFHFVSAEVLCARYLKWCILGLLLLYFLRKGVETRGTGTCTPLLKKNVQNVSFENVKYSGCSLKRMNSVFSSLKQSSGCIPSQNERAIS